MPDTDDPPLAAPAAEILAWYDRHRRVLPWRALPGQTPDPYRVWLSEIMLQQTTVAAAGDYFRLFTARWPDVAALAAAPAADVMAAWAGLGYYARARNLLACAGIVAEQHGGRFPQEEAALRALPGIGPYTAAAIAAIAFDRSSVVVDGNVERVMARMFRITEPLPDAKPAIRVRAAALTPALRPGDYAQAVMDLGATICVPRTPRCLACPWAGRCVARAAGDAAALPAKRAKPAKPLRRAIAFWAVDAAGGVLLRRRPPRGLLGGMPEFPSSPWRAQPMPDLDAALAAAPAPGPWRLLPGIVRHGFTHFDLEIAVASARIDGAGPADAGWFVPAEAVLAAGLPSVMAKIARHALGHAAAAMDAGPADRSGRP